jgi:hypothetical protein
MSFSIVTWLIGLLSTVRLRDRFEHVTAIIPTIPTIGVMDGRPPPRQ